MIMAFCLVLFSSSAHAWFDSNSNARTNVTVENIYGVTLTGFPAYVSRNITGFANSCQDVSFVNLADSAFLNYENENNTCGAINGSWWVNTATLVDGNNSFWAYHNQTTPTDNSDPPATWDSDYVYVFHMGENSNTSQYNSKQTAPNITGGVSVSNGAFGRGLFITASSAVITNGYNTAYGFDGDTVTWEAWIIPHDIGTNRGILGYTAGVEETGLVLTAGGALRFEAYNDGAVCDINGGSMSANNTYYIVGKMDGARCMAYLNGVNVANGTMAKSAGTTTNTIKVGESISGGLGVFNGVIDEVRISTANRSAEYIKEVYYNRLGAVFGATETNEAPTVTIHSPSNTTIYTESVLFNWSVVDPTNATLSCNQTIDGVLSGSGDWANNTYNVSTISSLAQGNHSVSVTCSDGTYESTVTNIYTVVYQIFYLQASSVYVQNWTAVFVNVTDSFEGSTTTTIMYVPLSDLPLGNVTVKTYAFGLETNQTNLTLNDSSETNTTFYMSASTFTINLFNETLGMETQLGNVTVVFDNITYQTQNFTVNSSIQFLTRTLPLQNTTVSLTYQGIQGVRKYYYTIDSNTSYVLNAFLPVNPTLFTFVTQSGSNYIDNTLITIQRYINGTYRTIAQGRTDISGRTTMYLDTGVTLNNIVSHPSYTTLTFYKEYSPAETLFTINLVPTSTGAWPNVNTFIDSDVYLNFAPNTTLFNNTVNVNITFSDAAAITSWVTINVTYSNWTNSTTYFYTNLSGSSSYTQNISLIVRSLTVKYPITVCMFRNGTEYCTSKTYTIQVLHGLGDWSAVDYDLAGGLSVYTWKLLALFIIMGFAGVCVYFFGTQGTMVMLILAFVVTGYFEIFSVLETIGLVIMCIIGLKLVS